MNATERASAGGVALAQRRSELLAVLLAELPPLVDEASAKRWCELIAEGSARGLIPGSQAGAAVRGVEVWLRVEAHELDVKRLRALQRQVSELERELARARQGR